MKYSAKYLCFFLAILLVLALTGCTVYEEPSGVVMGGWFDEPSYTINYNAQTIEYDGVEYTYAVDRSADSLTITIHYPNGATYYSAGTNAGWSDNYDPKAYASGETLVDLLDGSYTARTIGPSGINIFGLVFCLAFGLFGAIFPRAAWELEHLFKSWQYYSYEPSDAGLMMTRVGGIICIVAGVILFFVGWN